MRLKFIEYIINAACCECRCKLMMRIARFIARNNIIYFEKFKTIKTDADLVAFAKVLLSASDKLRAITLSFELRNTGVRDEQKP